MTTTSTVEHRIRWNLSDLYQSIDDPAIQATLDTGKQNAEHFVKAYKGKIAQLTASQLQRAFQDLEALINPLYKLSQYVQLVYSTQTDNDTVKALLSKVDEDESEINNQLVFFDLELGTVPQAAYDQWLAAAELQAYRYQLEQIRKTAKYDLSEEVEQVINLKDLSGVDAFKKLYEELTSAFEFEFEVDGQRKKMTGSELRALRQHSNKTVRREAMKLFYSRYEEHQLVLTTIYNNVIKNRNTELKLRKYSTPLSMKNIHNDLDDASVNALHEVTSQSYSLVQRYYRLKSQILNMPDMTLADIYAPMPSADRKYSWEEAKSIVLEGFKSFDSEIYDMTARMFDQNRIDAPVQKGKRGGAFCSSSTPDVDPYVLLNFLGRSRDVSTMAHELGHAVHAMLSRKQHLFYYHSILPLAETASVFAEMIITDKLLKQESDTLAKQAILTDKLEDIFATSHRQNMFSTFEIKTHDLIAKKRLSTAELCAIYQGELKAMFGDSVAQPAEYRWEWSSIPHIFESPFYVYAYNFGNLLVMGLYQQYLEQGTDFIPKYKQFLAAGSSMSPRDIAKIVQVDINDTSFWQKSMNYIEGLIAQLEALVNAPKK